MEEYLPPTSGRRNGVSNVVKVQLELEGEVAEVIWGLSRIGGGAPDVAQSLAGPQTAAAERKPAGTPAVLEPEIATTSAELPPARWTEELAGDFTAGLEPAGRRVALHVWRAGAAGIHRNTLCQRTDLSPVELRSLVMSMGRVLGRFQRERGMALSRPMAANSPLQSYFISAEFAAVASDLFGERMPDQLSSGLRRP